MIEEPGWRTALCWGAVVSFFILPCVILVIQIYAASHPEWLDQELVKTFIEPHIAYLQAFQRDCTYIVLGLAGLRALEQFKNGKTKHENGTLPHGG